MSKLWSLQNIINKIGIKPYHQEEYGVIYNNDCSKILPKIPDESVDLILTDPPYGINKADWDGKFLLPKFPIVPKLGLMPEVWNVMKSSKQIGNLNYKWILIAHLVNGMTRGGIGFGNYIPCIVYTDGTSIFESSTDCKDFVIGTEKKPDHPSPKPLRPVLWFVERLFQEQEHCSRSILRFWNNCKSMQRFRKILYWYRDRKEIL